MTVGEVIRRLKSCPHDLPLLIDCTEVGRDALVGIPDTGIDSPFAVFSDTQDNPSYVCLNL